MTVYAVYDYIYAVYDYIYAVYDEERYATLGLFCLFIRSLLTGDAGDGGSGVDR
jgi:hypothetical protein